jgi:5-methylcytosine-specific restriction endonuclease McrA
MCHLHYHRQLQGRSLGGPELLRQPLTPERLRLHSLNSSKKYNKTSRGKEANANNRRRRRTFCKEGYLPRGWLTALFEVFSCCLVCGTENDLTLDHVVPLISGGTHGIDNMQVLCRSHNSSKGSKTIDYRSVKIVDVIDKEAVILPLDMT